MASSVRELPTALLLIDVQKGFNHPSYWGASRSTPTFEENVVKLLHGFRGSSRTEGQHPLIVHVYHISKNPKSPLHPSAGEGINFMPYAVPLEDEPVISKTVNSTFIGTDLEGLLRRHDIRQLVICGLTTDHCVSTSTRMAANLGVTDHMLRSAPSDGQIDPGKVILVEDACATHNRGRFDAETMHAASIASLKDEFAIVMSTDDLLDALFRRSEE